MSRDPGWSSVLADRLQRDGRAGQNHGAACDRARSPARTSRRRAAGGLREAWRMTSVRPARPTPASSSTTWTAGRPLASPRHPRGDTATQLVLLAELGSRDPIRQPPASGDPRARVGSPAQRVALSLLWPAGAASGRRSARGAGRASPPALPLFVLVGTRAARPPRRAIGTTIVSPMAGGNVP